MKTKTDNSNNSNEFSTWVTVSHRGQIAIPINIRKKLKIEVGNRLLVVIRNGKDGINLIKSEALSEVFEKFTK